MTRFLQLANLPHLTDAKIEQLLASHEELEEVEVKNCASLSNKTLQLLANKYPRLQTVGWIDSRTANEEGYRHLIQSLALRALNVSGSIFFSSALCKELLQNSSSLKSLDVSFCPLADEAFSSIKAPLVFLNLQGCAEITDQTLHFLTKVPTLRRLVLGANKRLTIEGIELLKGLPLQIHRALHR